MLMDNNGNATFIYTPPSLHSRSATKAKDPRHAAKLYRRAEQDATGRWAAYHFTSFDNPFISRDAIGDLAGDMTSLAYRMEIMAEDIDAAPGALWKREQIDADRVTKHPPLDYIVVGVDPSASSDGAEAGIITAGRYNDDYYTLADDSIQGSPTAWATAAITAYYRAQANKIIAEKNNGGEMVSTVIYQIDPDVPVDLVWASRGKATRAEPVSAIYEKHRAHHVGNFEKLEDELCLWTPGDDSPNRLDALVWAVTDLVIEQAQRRRRSIVASA
jgi:phage terminase large subunit-like protein